MGFKRVRVALEEAAQLKPGDIFRGRVVYAITVHAGHAVVTLIGKKRVLEAP